MRKSKHNPCLIKTPQKKQKGFTLIELLVIISVVSFISSIVLVSLNNARIKARDVRRVSDIKQITKALEFFYNDNGHYPNTNWAGTAWACFDCILTSALDYDIYNITSSPAFIYSDIKTALTSYIKNVADPLNRKEFPYSGYIFQSDGKEYKLLAHRNPEDLRNIPANMVDPWRCGGFNSSTGQCNTNGASGAIQQSIGVWTAGAVNW